MTINVFPHNVQTIWEEVRQYWVHQVKLPKLHEVKESDDDDGDESDSRTCLHKKYF